MAFIFIISVRIISTYRRSYGVDGVDGRAVALSGNRYDNDITTDSYN